MSINHAAIESEARRLQVEIWTQRGVLFQTGEPPLVQQFTPEVAARVCGLEYEYRPFISAETGVGDYQAAGVLDRVRGIISISTQFGFEARRFTGAHEIGHFVLHDWVGERRAHRDRPIGRGHVGSHRPKIEQEADYFAACFLAPRKLVANEFERRFGRSPLALNETLAFHLCGKESRLLLTAPSGSLDFAAAVAGAQSLDGHRFPSLAQTFGLSISAMAVRIRELGLVAE